MAKIGIVDTMFSRVDMGSIAIDELKKNYPDVGLCHKTVPGVKDLPVECKRLLEGGCDAVLALGMIGSAPIDAVCGHEASQGIQQVKLLTNKHIIEVFVHESEAWSEREFFELCDNRVRRHAHNAVLLVTMPGELIKKAGMGVRQGREDEGPIKIKERKLRIAFVVSEFNSEITERMEERAGEVLLELGAAPGRVLKVAGVFEMPLAVKMLLYDKQNDAVVTLGVVVKGETAHDEVIVKTVACKLQELALEFRKPVTLGIIGHDADWEAAEERAAEYAERAVRAAVGFVGVLGS